MLEIFSKVVAAVLQVCVSFFIVKYILESKEKIYSLKNIFVLVIFIMIVVLVYNVNYSPLAPIITFLLMIIAYKLIFKLDITKAILVVGITMVIYFIADLIVTIIFLSFVDSDVIRKDPKIFIFSNILVALIVISLIFIKPLRGKFSKFIIKIENNKYYDKILFIILIIIVFSFIIYNITTATILSRDYLINILIMFIFFALTFIFIREKNQKDQLNTEYDTLMEYVQNFEEWIEDEQLNRHESDNQLAVIRGMVKRNKKAIQYIDSIIKEKINVDDIWINEIKHLPSGGIKGLLYYKLILTKKENIEVCLSVSRDTKDFIKNIDKVELKNINRLLGIYLDNAIEATKDTDNKVISLEIYPMMNKLIIVISNTYKGRLDIKKIRKKNYSTKGKNRVKGLYFADKIIKRSQVLESESSIINNFYVQKIIISNSKKD